MATHPRRHSKTVSEVRNVAIDMRGKLDEGESMTGTPTIVEVTTSALTLFSKVVNSSTLVINSQSVPAGGALQFRVSGGVSGANYRIKCTCGTNSSPSQTLIESVFLSVTED